MVTFHNTNGPELWNFEPFMMALHLRFKDPLVDHRVLGLSLLNLFNKLIKTLRQGRWPVAEYTDVFCDWACCVDWPEDILVSCFKDEVNNDLYHACIA